MSKNAAKKPKLKQQHKQAVAQQMQQTSAELQWAEHNFHAIDAYFVNRVNNDVARRYKGSDDFPKHFGARVEINERFGRYDVLEFETHNERGPLNEDGTQAEGIYRLGYVTFDRLKRVHEDAHKNGRQTDIGWAYVPHVPFEFSVEKALAAQKAHERFEAKVQAHLSQALALYHVTRDELKAEWARENDEGKYVGICFFYNPETAKLEYVVQKHGVTDLIDGANSERDFRDLPGESAIGEPLVIEGDTDFRNYKSCVQRLVAETSESKWERISKPNKERMSEAADRLVERMIENAHTVFNRAKEKATADGVTAELSLRFNGLRGLLEVVYKDDLGNLVQVDLGTDAAAVLMVMTRIEPDLAIYTTPRFNDAFVKEFGEGDKYVRTDDGKIIATNVQRGETPLVQIVDELPYFDESELSGNASPVQELDDAFDKDAEHADDENYALKG